ncbi:hypothetical protein CC78DRAFT_578820 [Lojkania enalia]|uniref:Uncharacterized protein n=1 Tax=Lojkania enalia TaxID=147567 RepID=A0A9P4KB13_9PLEO|nr:hypothetical protein CC78DRAFT_578820 [Didymosphaeria enalia]
MAIAIPSRYRRSCMNTKKLQAHGCISLNQQRQSPTSHHALGVPMLVEQKALLIISLANSTFSKPILRDPSAQSRLQATIAAAEPVKKPKPHHRACTPRSFVATEERGTSNSRLQARTRPHYGFYPRTPRDGLTLVPFAANGRGRSFRGGNVRRQQADDRRGMETGDVGNCSIQTCVLRLAMCVYRVLALSDSDDEKSGKGVGACVACHMTRHLHREPCRKTPPPGSRQPVINSLAVVWTVQTGHGTYVYTNFPFGRGATREGGE